MAYGRRTRGRRPMRGRRRRGFKARRRGSAGRRRKSYGAKLYRGRQRVGFRL